METKICTNCKAEKSLSEFHRRSENKKNYRSWCKECHSKSSMKWFKNNPERTKELNRRQEKKKWREEYRKRYAEENKERINANRIARTYGITVEDYRNLLNEQGGVCAICETKGDRALSVDHCHETGKVRNLLCHYCNTAIGFLNDDYRVAVKAAKYLKRHATSSG